MCGVCVWGGGGGGGMILQVGQSLSRKEYTHSRNFNNNNSNIFNMLLACQDNSKKWKFYKMDIGTITLTDMIKIRPLIRQTDMIIIRQSITQTDLIKFTH